LSVSLKGGVVAALLSITTFVILPLGNFIVLFVANIFGNFMFIILLSIVCFYLS